MAAKSVVIKADQFDGPKDDSANPAPTLIKIKNRLLQENCPVRCVKTFDGHLLDKLRP